MRAEKYLGDNVTQAVITVPAYFDDAARTATRDAARLAGLEVLRLVNEPTAAALAYGLEHGVQGIYAIYDLGGGTFDLSLLNLEGEVFKVLSTGGDTQLGGDDMDRLLLTTLLSSQTELLAEDSLALIQARRIKEYLTDHENWSGSIQVKNNLLEGHITRLDFELLISPLIDKTLKICRQVVRDAQISLDQIKGVVLVGGATRIPLVRQKVERFFEQVPLTNINPDEVVALGAALQAEALTEGSQRLLLDVAPLSLGLETYGGVVEKIILRNSPIPASHWQDFTTFQDNQTGMSLHIVQGERELVQDCRSLAHFELRGIPLMKAGMARIRVTFTIDADGILTVSAREQTTGIHQYIDVKPSYGLTEEDLLRMIEESHSHARSDMDERLLREARVEAERLLHAVKEALKNDSDLLEESEKIEVKQEAEALISVLNSVKRDDIERKTERLRQVTNSWAERRMNQAMRKALKGKKL
jgi:molecular chaperone HscA